MKASALDALARYWRREGLWTRDVFVLRCIAAGDDREEAAAAWDRDVDAEAREALREAGE